MSQKHDSSGGYIGASPAQTSTTCPGVHSARHYENRTRTGNRPSGVSVVSTYTGANIGLVPNFAATLAPLTYNVNIVGNGQTIELRRNSDSYLVKSWVITNGATTGTDWTISGSSLTLTVPAAASAVLAAGQAITLTVPAKTVRTSDGFEVKTQQTVPGTVDLYGGSASAAAGSARAIQQVNPSAPSGTYWIKSVSGGSARQLYCDMTTDGGGWTRWFNQPNVSRANYPSYTITDYNIAYSFNVDSDHYSAAEHRRLRGINHSSGQRLDYLFEQTNGNYKWRIRGYFEGDPGVGNRNAANISNVPTSIFDFGWFNSTTTSSYWPGYMNSSSTSCVSSQNIHPFLGGNSGWNQGYFTLARGYHSDPGTSAGCGDHCGNIRRYWYVTPAVFTQENCFHGYFSITDISSPLAGTMRCYYREVGTLGAGSL